MFDDAQNGENNPWLFCKEKLIQELILICRKHVVEHRYHVCLWPLSTDVPGGPSRGQDVGQVHATCTGVVLILPPPEAKGLAQAARGLAGGGEPAVGPLGGGVGRDQGEQQEQQRGEHPDTVILLLRTST